MLQTKFVPVAIDQAYQRRQQDNEGEFYRKIAKQGRWKDGRGTSQGLYIASPDGKLISFRNNRGADRIRPMMESALANYRAPKVSAIEVGKKDDRYTPAPPPGGLIVRVRAKVLGGYEETEDQWRHLFQTAVSRDNLWVSKAEHAAIIAGNVPRSLQVRIAKFHLLDNTRGEPPMWNDDEVRSLEMKIHDGEVTGKVHLQNKSGDRGYEADIYGKIESKSEKIVRFDLIARGQFWGEGPYTGRAPKGKFPLAVSFTLADGSQAADLVPPQGSRGWVRGYIR